MGHKLQPTQFFSLCSPTCSHPPCVPYAFNLPFKTKGTFYIADYNNYSDGKPCMHHPLLLIVTPPAATSYHVQYHTLLYCCGLVWHSRSFRLNQFSFCRRLHILQKLHQGKTCTPCTSICNRNIYCKQIIFMLCIVWLLCKICMHTCTHTTHCNLKLSFSKTNYRKILTNDPDLATIHCGLW